MKAAAIWGLLVMTVTPVLAAPVGSVAQLPTVTEDLGPPEPLGAVVSFAEADIDEDGYIELGEARAFGFSEPFDTADDNGDGRLDELEWSGGVPTTASQDEEWGIAPGVADHDDD